jgi:hypothetical protein
MSNDTSRSYASLSEIQSSAATSQLVDILITHTWAQSITQFSAVPLPNSEFATPCAPLDDVVRRIKPRYYFASGGGRPPQFWEREPFIWDDTGRVCRFISLGAFGMNPTDGKKQRVGLGPQEILQILKFHQWFYAFTIQPSNAASSSMMPIGAKCRRCESIEVSLARRSPSIH